MTLSEARRWQHSPDPEVRAAAERRLGARSASRARTAPRRKAGAAEKQASREERLERLARYRNALHAESGGRCVICGGDVPLVKMHAHHIIGGNGKRRTYEDLVTMAPAHRKCHDIAHGKDGKDPLPALRSLLSWCGVTDRVDAAAALLHRIAKIEEARASSVRRAEGGRP